MLGFDWFAAVQQSALLLPAAVRKKNGGNVLLEIMAQHRQTELADPEELRAQQGVLLDALARHCGAHSPYFAERLTRAGIKPELLAQPEGWAGLPPMSRQELMRAGSRLFCARVPANHGRVAPTNTSGSTGEPVTVRRPELCQQHWLAYTLREHLWHNRDSAGRLAVVRANMTKAMRQENWGPPIDQVLKTGPAEGRPPGESVEAMADWLVDFQPNELLMLPNALAGVLGALAASGRKLEQVRAVRTLSETVTPELRQEVRRVLDLEIADVYSSQEGGVMAAQCPEHGLYHVSETVLLEVLRDDGRPCAPGEVGRVVITDLLNYATPLLRYEIGDYAEGGPPRCACGRSSPTVRRFLGRERNLLIRPDGKRQWPTLGYRQWAELLPVRQFQFIQEDRETVTARFSVEQIPTAEQQARLTSIIQNALGFEFTIRYEWSRGPLARGPGGKFEEFICRVPRPEAGSNDPGSWDPTQRA